MNDSMEPPPRPSPDEHSEAAWRRMRASPIFSERRFSHFRPGFLEKAPIQLWGVASSGLGSWVYLYVDAGGRRQAYRADDHDRAGIAKLFAGAEGWLPRLWPAPSGWDDEAAAETLLHFGSCIGAVDAAALGFDLQPW